MNGRERQREGRAGAGRAGDADLAAVGLADPEHQIQAETAAVNLLRDRLAAAIERLENVFAVLGVDADAAIFNREHHLLPCADPGIELRRYTHPSRLSAVLDRVADQVLQRGFQ